MTRTEVSSQRPSITYVMARNPTSAFTTVITSAGAILRTQAILHLRDCGRPRPHPVPHRDDEAAARGQHEFDPRPEADEPDALARLDLIPGPHIWDDAAGRSPRHPGEPERAGAGPRPPP